jgi:hypothetical protein
MKRPSNYKYNYALREGLKERCGSCIFWVGNRAEYSDGECRNKVGYLYKKVVSNRGHCQRYVNLCTGEENVEY